MEKEIACITISNPTRSPSTSRTSTLEHTNSQVTILHRGHKSSVRIQIVLLLASCIFCTDLLRLNFNIALPFMLNETDSRTQWPKNGNHCRPIKPVLDLQESPKDVITVEKLEWTPFQQAILVSSFYLGAAIIGLPAYYISIRKAPRQLLMTAVAFSSLLSIFVPTAAFFGFPYAFGVRFFQGAAKAFVMPNVLRIAKSWIPVDERPKAFLICALGFSMAHIVGAPFIVVLSTIKATFGGWPVTYYISATIGFTWMALWVLIATSDPERHQRMSRQEKGYILDSIEKQQLECQLHQSSFPQGFSAVWKSSNLAYILACFVFSAGLTFWENFGLTYSMLVVEFQIIEQLLWIVDFAPFMAYALVLMVMFYFKRRYEMKIMDESSDREQDTSHLRWLTGAGVASIMILLLPLPFFNTCNAYWLLLNVCLGCAMMSTFSLGQYSLFFQYIHIEKVRILLISSVIAGDTGSALSSLALAIFARFVQGQAWLITCATISGLAIIGAMVIVMARRGTPHRIRKDDKSTDLMVENAAGDDQ